MALKVSVNSFTGLEAAKIEAELIVLKAAFSSCESRYQFEVRSDSTGKIFYPDSFSDSEEIFHEVDLGLLVREIEDQLTALLQLENGDTPLEKAEVEELRSEIITERLEEVFWEEINGTLEDPFYRSFDDQNEWGDEFSCENGTREELESFLELCVLTERGITDANDYLVVNSGTECEGAGIGYGGYSSERLVELVEIACQHFEPVGYSYTYNDGWGDRYSGYSMDSESICISLKESVLTPAREKMLAMIRLREKLLKMEVTAEKINRVTTF